MMKDKSKEGWHLYRWRLTEISLNEGNLGIQKSNFSPSTTSCQSICPFKITKILVRAGLRGVYVCMYACECVKESVCVHACCLLW